MSWGPAAPPELSSDRVADCAWGTTCWHNRYYEAFVRNGLVVDTPPEGSLWGVLRYRIEALTTQDLFTSLTILFSVLLFLAGLAYGRREQMRMHTVEVLMSLFLSDTLARENPRMASLMRRARAGSRSRGTSRAPTTRPSSPCSTSTSSSRRAVSNAPSAPRS